jgi:membrane protease YdiL (CAAX protease family)
MATTPVSAGSTGRRRVAELALLFTAGPALLTLGPRWLVSVGILASGLLCAGVLLRDPTFPRRELVGAPGIRPGLGIVLRRAVFVSLGLVVVAVATVPKSLFAFPRHRTSLWLLVMVLYPLSAYAQEIVFRTFFFHRYGHLFSTGRRRILASGLIFGWAHVVVNDLAAIPLAAVAGLLFASTYERSRSTLLVSIEHAIYGDVVFTIGLGSLFYSSARWIAH